MDVADADVEDETLEDDVFVLESIAEAKKNDEERLRVIMVVSLLETVASIAKIFRIVEVIGHSLLMSAKFWHFFKLIGIRGHPLSTQVQGATKRLWPGCVNAAGKLRQKW